MAKPGLKLSSAFSLPLDATTESIAIVAKRRVGKSYLMRRLVEQLILANQQVVLVDPKGDQWGICFSADGKGPGLPVVILGGEHGHVPLEPIGGELVAQLVVEDRVSVLIDLSLFRKHQVATFMAHFLETLYRLKAKEEFRTPMQLVIDEADAIAPQNPKGSSQSARGEGGMDNTARMLGAAEDIVRRGGQRGIGCTLVTQRSAVLNKNVLTQAQVLISLRTIAPQDLKALEAWIDVHGTVEQRKVLMESLPSLPVGDAWIWSPGWPTDAGIFQRIHVDPITTFDSAATPKPGEKLITPKNPAEVDLALFSKRMADTIEKARDNDPKELKRQIAELQKQIGKAVPVAGDTARVKALEEFAAAQDTKIIELTQKIDGLETIIVEGAGVSDDIKCAVQTVFDQFDRLRDVLDTTRIIREHKDRTPVRPFPHTASAKAKAQANPESKPSDSPPTNGELKLNKKQQAILDAIAWWESIGMGWALSLKDQCEAAGVAFFMKQLGKHPLGSDHVDGVAAWPITDAKGHNIEEFPEPLRVRQFPEGM